MAKIFKLLFIGFLSGLLIGILSATVIKADFFDFAYWHIHSSTTKDLYKAYSQEGKLSYNNIAISTPTYFNLQKNTSDVVPNKLKLIKPGELGYESIQVNFLTDSSSNKLISTDSNSTYSPTDQREIEGTLDFEEFTNLRKNELGEVFNDLVTKDSSSAQSYFSDFNQEVNLKENRSIENLSIEFGNIDQKNIVGNSEYVVIDRAKINMGTCNKLTYIPVLYYFDSDSISYLGYESIVGNMCSKTGLLGFYFNQSCSDCTYYPLDRYTSLPNSLYEPNDVIYASDIPGGQYISQRAYSDLKELYLASVSAGVPLYIVSGYRSYYVQANTFESWVQYEIANNGYDRATAESIASTYAARAGYSEHQLGVTVDLGAQGCSGFNNCNAVLWSWLNENAYKYGFVLSYPEGSQSKTGYVHEPWHYRWLGKAYAAEFNAVKANYIPSQWLKLKNDGEI